MIPEAEAIHTIVTFSYSKKRFTVITFYAGNKIELTVKFYGTRVENAVDADSFSEVRIGVRVEVVTPD
ncbi:hypothetical protein D3C71_1619980 [compost metagenome]